VWALRMVAVRNSIVRFAARAPVNATSSGDGEARTPVRDQGARLRVRPEDERRVASSVVVLEEVGRGGEGERVVAEGSRFGHGGRARGPKMSARATGPSLRVRVARVFIRGTRPTPRATVSGHWQTPSVLEVHLPASQTPVIPIAMAGQLLSQCCTDWP